MTSKYTSSVSIGHNNTSSLQFLLSMEKLGDLHNRLLALRFRNKDLVLPLRIDHGVFFARMALLGQFYNTDIKVTFTFKTTLRVLKLFLGLTRKTMQTKPDSPNSGSDTSQPPQNT